MADEAQQPPIESVQLPSHLEENPIESFKLEMRLDATLTVNGEHWFKPGVSGSIKWKRLPTDDELKDAATYIQFGVIDPTMQDAIAHISQRLDEQRRRQHK